MRLKSLPRDGRSASRRSNAGFTLAELVVASTILAIVMGAVYSAFHSTVRAWKTADAAQQFCQDVRITGSILSHELNSLLPGTEYLFQGTDDELEFVTISEPMDVEDEKSGARLLWVRYRFDRTGKKLFREEAPILKAVPFRQPGAEEGSHTGVLKKGAAKKFELISSGILGMDITYYWIRQLNYWNDEPFEGWIEPIEKKENRQNWGLPQGLRVVLTVKDPHSASGSTAYTLRTTFRGPTTPPDAQRLGLTAKETL